MFVLLAATGFGCLGLGLGEQSPGGAVVLDEVPVTDSGEAALGSIAVHPDQNAAVVLRARTSRNSNGDVFLLEPRVFSVFPDVAHVSEPLLVDGESNISVAFSGDQYVLVSQRGEDSIVREVNLGTNIEHRRIEILATYGAVAASPSSQFVVAPARVSGETATHVIDTNTLELHAMPHSGQEMACSWLHARDSLVCVLRRNAGTNAATARLLQWDMSLVAANGFSLTDEGIWARPLVDIAIPGASNGLDLVGVPDNRVVVSEDDSRVVFLAEFRDRSTEQFATGEPRAVVWNVGEQSFRWLHNVVGPVDMLPDGSKIVLYREGLGLDENGSWHSNILVVDGESLNHTTFAFDVGFSPVRALSDAGILLIADPFQQHEIVRVNLATNAVTPLAGDHLSAFTRYVVSPGMSDFWVLGDGLFRVGVADGVSTHVALDFFPRRINKLPDDDRILLTSDDNRLRVFSTTENRVLQTLVIGDDA